MFSGVPGGADLYLLKSVLHDWGDDRAAAVLRSCRAAMTRAGARLLLIEQVMPERMAPEPAAVAHAVGDLMMLTRAGGRERTEAEFAALLAGAGLRLGRAVPTGSHYTVLEAGAISDAFSTPPGVGPVVWAGARRRLPRHRLDRADRSDGSP